MALTMGLTTNTINFELTTFKQYRAIVRKIGKKYEHQVVRESLDDLKRLLNNHYLNDQFELLRIEEIEGTKIV